MRPSVKQNKTSELEFWLTYSVGIGIIPLAFITLFSFSWQSLVDVLSHGELFIISLALSGERLGSIYIRKINVGSRRLSVFLMAFCGAAFGINSVGHIGEVQLISISIGVFVLTVVAGIASLWGK